MTTNLARCSCPSGTRTVIKFRRSNIRYTTYYKMQKLEGARNQVYTRCVTLSSTFLSCITLAEIPSNYTDNHNTPAETYHPCGTECGSRRIIHSGSRQAVPVIKQPAVYFRRTGPSHINRAVEVEFLTNPSPGHVGTGTIAPKLHLA